MNCVEFEFFLGPLKPPKLRTALKQHQPSSTDCPTGYNVWKVGEFFLEVGKKIIDSSNGTAQPVSAISDASEQ